MWSEAVHFLPYELLGLGISYLVFSKLEGSDQHWSSARLSSIHTISISRETINNILKATLTQNIRTNIIKRTTASLTFLKTKLLHAPYLSYYISSSTILGSCLLFTITCPHLHFYVKSNDQAAMGCARPALKIAVLNYKHFSKLSFFFHLSKVFQISIVYNIININFYLFNSLFN